MPAWLLMILENLAPTILQTILAELKGPAHAPKALDADLQAKVDQHEAALAALKKV